MQLQVYQPLSDSTWKWEPFQQGARTEHERSLVGFGHLFILDDYDQLLPYLAQGFVLEVCPIARCASTRTPFVKETLCTRSHA